MSLLSPLLSPLHGKNNQQPSRQKTLRSVHDAIFSAHQALSVIQNGPEYNLTGLCLGYTPNPEEDAELCIRIEGTTFSLMQPFSAKISYVLGLNGEYVTFTDGRGNHVAAKSVPPVLFQLAADSDNPTYGPTVRYSLARVAWCD